MNESKVLRRIILGNIGMQDVLIVLMHNIAFTLLFYKIIPFNIIELTYNKLKGNMMIGVPYKLFIVY